MIAIIDSGSTKADWVITDGTKISSYNTPGMNPNFINRQNVIEIISNGILKHISASDVHKVYFYGAGCSSIEQNKIISDAFGNVFINAGIYVDHDTHGAVISTCGNDEGIACIIGTGSNSV